MSEKVAPRIAAGIGSLLIAIGLYGAASAPREHPTQQITYDQNDLGNPIYVPHEFIQPDLRETIEPPHHLRGLPIAYGVALCGFAVRIRGKNYRAE